MALTLTSGQNLESSARQGVARLTALPSTRALTNERTPPPATPLRSHRYPFVHPCVALARRSLLTLALLARRYLALAKTFRLLRIGRLAKYMSDLGMVSFIRIIRILFIYLLFAHWGGCVFYLLMKNRSNNKHDTWIEATVADSYKSDDYPLAKFELKGCGETATVVEENRETCFDFPEMSQYWMVMYASMMIMMGDSIDCKNNYETVYAVGMSLVGACLTAMMFGQMAHIVAGMDAEDTRYEELMGHVRDQVSQLDLLPETRERVVDYYEFQWRINSGMDRQQFLGSLSPCLRIEILLSVYADIVGKM